MNQRGKDLSNIPLPHPQPLMTELYALRHSTVADNWAMFWKIKLTLWLFLNYIVLSAENCLTV